jgi:hypothetical protein
MTANEWRTDRPDVGRFIRQPCGSLLHVGCEAHAEHIASDAVTHPAHLAWRYIDPPPETAAAADLGTACAWIEVFMRVVVPLGRQVWRKDRPEFGRWVEHRDGGQTFIGTATLQKWCFAAANSVPELLAWRYLEPHEVPE